MISCLPIKAILFDLDGTLPDTLDDLADAANRVLAQAGLPVHDRAAYRRFVGDGGVDMKTARSAGMLPVGAAWGFRPREELIRSGAHIVLEHPGEVLGWVDGERTA